MVSHLNKNKNKNLEEIMKESGFDMNVVRGRSYDEI